MKKKDIGSVKCDGIDWGLFVAIELICVCFLIVGICIVKREYSEKLKHGYQFSPGDFEGTRSRIF